MAITKTLTQENGLTIHKVKAGVMMDKTSAQQVFEAIDNAQPNELFIIEDSPRYFVAIAKTSEYDLIDNIMNHVSYKDTSAVNTAQINGDGLKLSCVAPNTLLNNTGNMDSYVLVNPDGRQVYDVQAVMPYQDPQQMLD